MSSHGSRSPAGDQPVEVLDASGAVVDVVSRAEMRRRGLRHRTVFIAVLDSAGTRLLVHRRAPDKDVWADRWDVAFGGVVDPDEGWSAAARRELAEETGLMVEDANLEDLGAGSYADDRVDELSRVYRVASDEPVTCPDGEVVETRWVGLDDLADWLEGHITCPDGVVLVLPRLGVGLVP